ncbi:MAG TPA: sulfotransferase domain-containing protein, partial [Planctomycetaceae bacterium]|nr:sulfotransferase domain-containing protein [Planctomycetaceae bacterium]
MNSNQSLHCELPQALDFLGFVSPAELEDFPDFLLIAPPKTGTTWLAKQLGRHPGIYVSAVKEVKYFNFFQQVKDFLWYLSMFREGAGRLKGDVTPNYSLLPRSTIRLIHALRPDLKLIFLMRDPVDRAWSHARWDYRLRDTTFSSNDCTIEQVTDSMWQQNFSHPLSVLFGDYLGQLQRWLGVFDRSRFFIGFYEQIQQAPHELLDRIFDFLGVERLARVEEARVRERVNAGLSWRLTPELQRSLRRIYAGRTRQLADFLGHEFGTAPPAEWNDTLGALETSESGPRASAAPVDAVDSAGLDDLCDKLARSIDDSRLSELLHLAEEDHPQFLDSYREWNIVKFRGRFYGI